MKKKRINIFLISLLLATNGFSQTKGYRFTATVNTVTDDGFYNILITPEINAHLKTDYTDLRIINSTGKWVPHLLRYPNAEKSSSTVLWDLGIVRNSGNASSTEVVVGPLTQPLSNITFSMRNSRAERFGTLTGSDDSTRWFMISDSVLIRPVLFTPQESRFSFEFRPTTYKFYKLTIDNRGKAPYAMKDAYNLARAERQDSNSLMWQPILNPPPVFSQRDSAQTSYIKVTQQAKFHVDGIELKVGGAAYYNRQVQLYIDAAGSKTRASSRIILSTFTISNNGSLRFTVPVLNNSVFYLAIFNGDNLPLKVQAVNTYYRKWVATVYLEKTNSYNIIMDNAAAVTPSYDLELADVTKSESLRFAATGSVTRLPEPAGKNVEWYRSKWLLWSLIIASAALLSFFTFRLTKDLGAEKE